MSRLFITLVVLLAATAAKAEYEFPNYFTMGANDTLCIAQGCDTVTAPVKAHFSDGVSRWDLTVTYPEGLNPIGLYGGPDMDVTYLNSEGQTCIYHAVVTASQELTVISSSIPVAGYWPYGSGYFSFGSAMWPQGDYDEMFYLTFVVDHGFLGGSVTIDGSLMGNAGPYGGVGNVSFFKEVTVVVSTPDGDVNGDGDVNIADVTALIRQVLSDNPDETGDLNGDGAVTIADVALLVSTVLHKA